MKRTVTRLADGRELIYFDRRDDADRSAADERPLPGRAAASELRYDPLLDEWVAVAAHRQTRTFLPSADDCPLCPSSPGRPTEIPSPEYEVVVFENRFPSYGDGVSGGRCEVMCFTSEHGRSFAELPPEQVQTVIEAWADRTAELSAFPGVEQVFCFENRGEAIGVTLHHPHGQIYGYPFVPPRTRRMLDVAGRHPGDLFAEVLAAEREEAVRVVAANELWTAFVPKAARWPYEVHVYPHRRVPDLPALDGAEREAFGALYLDLLSRLDRLFGMPLPYVSAWHQAPVRTDRDLAWLHLELFSVQRAPGKLKYLAGSESAMGAFVNDVSPEDAARRLREA
ncbi:galactose-1-phosphate uridylyltransferase [Actinomadura fulvescens]|uniref:Galactose-1-phosphate uridylyltransferase n=1 Tax=Actinomadura fulvescens TaxID=46160 RepID=A0ABN3PFQ6_9ACTN